jgi:hypothetical protein
MHYGCAINRQPIGRPMERPEIIEMMGELELARMRAAFDERASIFDRCSGRPSGDRAIRGTRVNCFSCNDFVPS